MRHRCGDQWLAGERRGERPGVPEGQCPWNAAYASWNGTDGLRVGGPTSREVGEFFSGGIRPGVGDCDRGAGCRPVVWPTPGQLVAGASPLALLYVLAALPVLWRSWVRGAPARRGREPPVSAPPPRPLPSGPHPAALPPSTLCPRPAVATPRPAAAGWGWRVECWGVDAGRLA